MSKSALKILNTAEKLFNAQNFHSVGVDLIRDESGCSKTTLYTYYRNKSQLVYAVLEARDQRFKQALLTAIGDSQGHDAIHQIFDWHLDWFQQDQFKGCLFVRVVAESEAHELALIQLSQAHKSWIKNLILKYCPTPNASYCSEMIYTLIEGLISRFLVDGFDVDIAEMTRKMINHLLLQTPVDH